MVYCYMYRISLHVKLINWEIQKEKLVSFNLNFHIMKSPGRSRSRRIALSAMCLIQTNFCVNLTLISAEKPLIHLNTKQQLHTAHCTTTTAIFNPPVTNTCRNIVVCDNCFVDGRRRIIHMNDRWCLHMSSKILRF